MATKAKKFSEMSSEHQWEITKNLGTAAAKKTRWAFYPKFPTEEAAVMADEVYVMISDRRVRDVVLGLEAGGEFRPILMDGLGEDVNEFWMEGIHRTTAAVELGLKTVPAFIRTE